METFGPAAGAEALFRAFLAEHDHDRFAARFWLQVYRNIVAEERGEGIGCAEPPAQEPLA
jgi:hypothetical protein